MVCTTLVQSTVVQQEGPQTIALVELLPIVVALAIWGDTYRRRGRHCDNAAVISQINQLHA